MGSWLVATRKEVVSHVRLKHLGGNEFRYPESAQGKPYLHWLIQMDGRFRKFVVTGHDQEWLRPLGFLWGFVKVRCILEPSRSITVGEIRALLKEISDHPSPEDELRFDLELAKFLEAHNADEVFTKEQMRAFMNEPENGEVERFP